jgi:hypothetical protein
MGYGPPCPFRARTFLATARSWRAGGEARVRRFRLCAVRLTLDERTPTIDALAIEQPGATLGSQLDDLAAIHRVLAPPSGSLRLTATELDRHRAEQRR